MWWKRGVAVAAVAGLLLLAWSIWDHEAALAWMGQARPLPFFAAMAILPAVGAPLTPLFILAGATFGVRVGLIGAGVALASNLALCYWIARSRLRSWLASLLRRFDYEIPDFRGAKRDAVRFTLMLKFAPGIPAFVKNYGLGVAGVPFALYFVASMLITGVYGACLIVLGESLFEHELNRSVAVAAVVLALAVGLWLWRRRRRERRLDA